MKPKFVTRTKNGKFKLAQKGEQILAVYESGGNLILYDSTENDKDFLGYYDFTFVIISKEQGEYYDPN